MPNFADLSNTQIISVAITVSVTIVLSYYVVRGGSKKSSKAPVFGDDQTFWPYVPLTFMTDSEVAFFKLLKQAVPELYICAQVQLSRIIAPNELGEDAARKNAIWRSRIAQMSVDYLLVDSDMQTPLAVIELDDWSHELADRQVADAKKDKALSCARVPVLRFHGEHLPDVKTLRHRIISAIND